VPKQDRGNLIAEFPAFGGARIPLLSDEECRARGMPPGRLPPRETWTQAQRDAADRLIEILEPHVLREAPLLIAAEPSMPSRQRRRSRRTHRRSPAAQARRVGSSAVTVTGRLRPRGIP
jgi:hypothetical protein